MIHIGSAMNANDDASTKTVSRILRSADRAVVAIMQALRILAGLVILAMMLTTAYDVVMRYVFSAPTEWALTLNAAAVVASTFLAVPHLAAVRGHINMDLLYHHLGPNGKMVADIVTGLATLTFGACITWLAYRAALSAYVNGLLSAGNFPIPQWTLYALIYVGGLGLTLVVLLAPWRRADGNEPTAPKTASDEVL